MIFKGVALYLLLVSICFFAGASAQEQKLEAPAVLEGSILRRQDDAGTHQAEAPSAEVSDETLTDTVLDVDGTDDATPRLLKAKKGNLLPFYHSPEPVQKKQPRVIIQHLTKIPVQASKVPVYSGKHSLPLHSEKHSLPYFPVEYPAPLSKDSHSFKAPHRLLKKKKISSYYPEVPVEKKEPVVVIQQSKIPVRPSKLPLYSAKQPVYYPKSGYHGYGAPHRLLKKKLSNYYPAMPVEKKQPVMVIQQSKPVMESHKFPLHETKHSADYGMHKHDFAAPHRYLKKKRANYYPQMPVQKKQPIMVVQRPSKKSGPMLQYSSGFGKKSSPGFGKKSSPGFGKKY